MSLKPFAPNDIGDLLDRYDELHALAENPLNNTASLHNEIRELIYQCERLVPFGTVSAPHIALAKNRLDDGGGWLALAELYLAIHQHVYP